MLQADEERRRSAERDTRLAQAEAAADAAAAERANAAQLRAQLEAELATASRERYGPSRTLLLNRTGEV